MKVALYARVSTDDKGQDPEVQLGKLRKWAEARKYDIFEEYVDQASGGNPRRPALDLLLADARRHEFDAILITKLDRMMRSTRNLLNVLELLDGYSVALICSDQDIDTKSPVGKLLFTVLGAIAEFERDLISSRVKDGMAKAKAEGKHVGHRKGEKNRNKRGSKKTNPFYRQPSPKTEVSAK